MNISPGPWTIDPLRGKYYGTHITLGDGNGVTVWTPDHYADPFGSEREIANGWEPKDGCDHVEDVRSYANARLIAAAPDLLKACEEAVKEMRDSLGYPSDDWDCFDKLCAAIAKATGGQDN